jgi:hypothetical protein
VIKAAAIRFEFSGLPPFKASGTNRSGAVERQKLFAQAAEQTIVEWRSKFHKGDVVVFPWDPMTAKISLDITYQRFKGDNDAANIIGGICDALQRLFYADDKQVIGITYREEAYKDAMGDLLTVEISPLGGETVFAGTSRPTGTERPGWDSELDQSWAARASMPGASIPGPKAAMDAARVFGVPKLKDSPHKTLQSVLDSSEFLKGRWVREENTIRRI